MWQYTGAVRPAFAEATRDDEESVWDYPRPPALVDCEERIVVQTRNAVIADSSRARRVLETASPPTYYLPPTDVDLDRLLQQAGSSYCEWKGRASYWALADGSGDSVVAWSYEKPRRPFQPIRGYIAFYPGRLPCYVDGQRVAPQPGHFYGGWVTDRIVGPFKGEPGSEWW